MGKRTPGVEVVHMTQFLHQALQEEGSVHQRVPLTVTYRPCHLGRLAEPWVHWQGKRSRS
jgi:Fe-S oxidoreductase